MKKALALLLSLLLLLSLAACSSDTATTTDAASTTAEPTVATANTDAAEPEEPEATTEPEAAAQTPSSEIDFEETVVVDTDECTVTITGIDPDNEWGYTVKARFENKSEDTTYMFSIEYATVNGVMCDPFFATEVAAGKKSNEEITFYDSLEDYGITDYTDIEMTLQVYDSDDWSADDVVYTTFHVYPYGEENATTYVREAQDTDTVLIDNEYVTVTVIGYEHDDFWGYTVNLFLVNKTDATVMYSADMVSVNGYMVDPYYADYVPAGKCAFSSMCWFDEDLEENGIDEVEEIEFTLSAYDYDDWYSDDYFSEVVTLYP